MKKLDHRESIKSNSNNSNLMNNSNSNIIHIPEKELRAADFLSKKSFTINNSQSHIAVIRRRQGIEYQRLLNADAFKNLQDFIKCKICFQILINPVDCCGCQKTFCADCIMLLKENSKNCPFGCDLHQVKIKNSSAAVKSVLLFLKFSCVNSDCQTEISYGEILTHEENCEFAFVTCPNLNCNQSLLKKNLEKHVKIECEFNTFICEYCEKEFKKSEFDTHLNSCKIIHQLLADKAKLPPTSFKIEDFIKKLSLNNLNNLNYNFSSFDNLNNLNYNNLNNEKTQFEEKKENLINANDNNDLCGNNNSRNCTSATNLDKLVEVDNINLNIIGNNNNLNNYNSNNDKEDCNNNLQTSLGISSACGDTSTPALIRNNNFLCETNKLESPQDKVSSRNDNYNIMIQNQNSTNELVNSHIQANVICQKDSISTEQASTIKNITNKSNYNGTGDGDIKNINSLNPNSISNTDGNIMNSITNPFDAYFREMFVKMEKINSENNARYEKLSGSIDKINEILEKIQENEKSILDNTIIKEKNHFESNRNLQSNNVRLFASKNSFVNLNANNIDNSPNTSLRNPNEASLKQITHAEYFVLNSEQKRVKIPKKSKNIENNKIFKTEKVEKIILKEAKHLRNSNYKEKEPDIDNENVIDEEFSNSNKKINDLKYFIKNNNDKNLFKKNSTSKKRVPKTNKQAQGQLQENFVNESLNNKNNLPSKDNNVFQSLNTNLNNNMEIMTNENNQKNKNFELSKNTEFSLKKFDNLGNLEENPSESNTNNVINNNNLKMNKEFQINSKAYQELNSQAKQTKNELEHSKNKLLEKNSSLNNLQKELNVQEEQLRKQTTDFSKLNSNNNNPPNTMNNKHVFFII